MPTPVRQKFEKGSIYAQRPEASASHEAAAASSGMAKSYSASNSVDGRKRMRRIVTIAGR